MFALPFCRVLPLRGSLSRPLAAPFSKGERILNLSQYSAALHYFLRRTFPTEPIEPSAPVEPSSSHFFRSGNAQNGEGVDQDVLDGGDETEARLGDFAVYT